MRHPIRGVGAALALLLVASAACAENWPQWRGPNNDGTSSETGLPASWSATENLRWRVPLPGAAGSTPVVWDDRIFLTSADGENVSLISMSDTGEELWSKPFSDENWEIRGGEGNAASPSPVTDGEHVWAFASNGDLASYTVDGEQVWTTNIEDRYGEFDMYFVMASSPWLDGDRLYMQLIHSNGWIVLALDKHTGDEVWVHKRSSDARSESEQSYASPFLYRDSEREFLISHGADYVVGHSLVDGSEVWRCGGLNPQDSYNPSLRFVASPVAVPGLIVVPSAKNGPVLALSPDASGDITDTGASRVWSRERGTPDVPSPLIHDGLVYLCRENGNLIVMDAKSGEELYDEPTHRHRHRASPVYADGKVYLTARDGVVTVVKAGREFEVIATNELGETVSSSPVISNGTIYLRTYDALWAVAQGG
jgi:outer membrane protein assembly factor BamB